MFDVRKTAVSGGQWGCRYGYGVYCDGVRHALVVVGKIRAKKGTSCRPAADWEDRDRAAKSEAERLASALESDHGYCGGWVESRIKGALKRQGG